MNNTAANDIVQSQIELKVLGIYKKSKKPHSDQAIVS